MKIRIKDFKKRIFYYETNEITVKEYPKFTTLEFRDEKDNYHLIELDNEYESFKILGGL